VLDLTLPRLTGWQFLEQSREELDRRNIPVLIVFGITSQRDDPSGLGVAAWLTKPLDLDRFLAAAESLASPAHRVARPGSTAPAERTTRLLVVEDDAPIRQLMVDCLRDEGYLVRGRVNPRGARTDSRGSARPSSSGFDAARREWLRFCARTPQRC
jgi:DNA-binding response OmpR family regulator